MLRKLGGDTHAINDHARPTGGRPKGNMTIPHFMS